jgi:hypothetical protein
MATPTAPTVPGTCLSSDQLGKLGLYCRASAPFCDSDAGVCTHGVCLTVATGDLGQPCKSDGSCNQPGLSCSSLDGKPENNKCYCADDSKLGEKCDGKGAVCVGNSFNTQFQYIYNQMYATFKGDTTPAISGTFKTSVDCFNACPTGSVRANYDGANNACYCYNAASQPATFVVVDDTAKSWATAYADMTKFPKTTVPPP